MLKLCLQNFSLNHDHDHDHEENIWSRTITRDREIDDHAGHYTPALARLKWWRNFGKMKMFKKFLIIRKTQKKF